MKKLGEKCNQRMRNFASFSARRNTTAFCAADATAKSVVFVGDTAFAVSPSVIFPLRLVHIGLPDILARLISLIFKPTKNHGKQNDYPIIAMQ